MTDPTAATPEQSEPTVAETPAVPAQRLDASAVEAQATEPDKGQAHDPWSRDANTVAVSAADMTAAYPESTATFETVPSFAAAPSFAGAAGLDPVTTPAKRRRRTPIVVAIALVLVLIGAGAAYAVRVYVGAGIVEPESAVPASVGAFARIDLSPGLRDKLSFNDLVKKFPTNGKSTEDLVTKQETKIATAAGLNYDTDVKPWFGGRAGVAEWTNASGNPVALLVFSSTDDAKAKVTLAKVQAKQGASFGFVLRGGYALIAGADSGAQADAIAASDAAAAHNLAGSANYKSAVSHISGNNLVIAYADLSKLGALLSKEAGSLTSGALSGDGSPLPAGAASAITGITGIAGGAANPLAKLTGTVIVGGAVVSDGIEIRAHAQGLGTNAGTPTNVRPTMDAMPDTTTVGFALDGLDPNSDTGKQLSQLLNNLPADDGSDMASTLSGLSGPLMSIVTSKVISLSITGFASDLPSGFLAIDTRDAATAQSLIQTINGLTGGKPLVPGMSVAQNGTHVQATMGGPVSTGKLGGTSLYTETTAGMSNETSMGYIDVTKLIALAESAGAALPAKVKSELAPIKAIGIGASVSGTSQDSVVRIVIK